MYWQKSLSVMIVIITGSWIIYHHHRLPANPLKVVDLRY